MEALGLQQRVPGTSIRPPATPGRRQPASDESLVAGVRQGSEEAFTSLWERYHRPLLSYCRHVLGSHHEAEEAVQQVFVNAYRAMAGDDERELQVRPWLYRIARNQCLSMLRARRPTEELGAEEPSLVGLSDEVAGRADLRAMLRDLAALPTDQREALVLAELHDNSHAEVAEILGCDHNKVKSLVFQARTSLMTSRQARELRCEEVQSQLSVLRGGSLRRAVLRRHLAECDACRLFGAEVKRQRAALAVVLPVVPTGGLKLGAATALAAGTGAAASTGTATTAGAGAGIAAKVGLGVPATLLKSAAATLAVTTAAAAGVATTAQVAHVTGKPPAPITQPAEQSRPPAPGAPGNAAGAQPPPVAPGAAGRQPRALPAGKRSDQPLQGGPFPPGAHKPNGLSRRPQAEPQKQRPTRPARPIHGKRPARRVPARKPGERPARVRPRPDATSEPIRPTEPIPPAGDGSQALP